MCDILSVWQLERTTNIEVLNSVGDSIAVGFIEYIAEDTLVGVKVNTLHKLDEKSTHDLRQS
jgi:hypothetical protein